MISKRLLVPVCAILVACGTSVADDIVTDSGPDSPSDGSKPDTGVDSGKHDTGVDTGIDTGVDSGEEDSGVDADDAQADVKPPQDGGQPDGSLCMLGIGFGSISMQGCTLGQDWSCGNDKYEFDCTCPGATCTCTKNGQLVQTVQSPNGCPKCTFNNASIAQLCGFPY